MSEPLLKLDVSEPDLVAHGALVTGLVSTDQGGFGTSTQTAIVAPAVQASYDATSGTLRFRWGPASGTTAPYGYVYWYVSEASR